MSSSLPIGSIIPLERSRHVYIIGAHWPSPFQIDMPFGNSSDKAMWPKSLHFPQGQNPTPNRSGSALVARRTASSPIVVSIPCRLQPSCSRRILLAPPSPSYGPTPSSTTLMNSNPLLFLGNQVLFHIEDVKYQIVFLTLTPLIKKLPLGPCMVFPVVFIRGDGERSLFGFGN